MKAVIYCRVSTKEQVQNLSLPTQLRACREYCEREGYEVAKVFTDAGQSAKTTDRPDFKKLLEYCRVHKHDVQFVVFYNITRFSRSTHDFAIARMLLQRLGISPRSVNEPLSDDPVGNLTGNILAAIGQFDNDEKARRTAAGMQAALELGRWPFKAPIGYLNGAQGGRGIVILDPDRAPLVTQAFEEVGAGHRSRTEVLRRVTARGLTTRAGKPLSAQSFANLLRNRFYAGWVEVPKWGVSGRGDFEALVPDPLFRRVQRLLGSTGDSVRRYRRRHPDFPLRRFVTCGQCEAPLTGSWSTGRAKKYAYYHCRKCRGVKIAKLDLEDAFLTLLGRLQPERATCDCSTRSSLMCGTPGSVKPRRFGRNWRPSSGRSNSASIESRMPSCTNGPSTVRRTSASATNCASNCHSRKWNSVMPCLTISTSRACWGSRSTS